MPAEFPGRYSFCRSDLEVEFDRALTMRPPRIIILVLFFSATLFLFCRSVFHLGLSFRRDSLTVPTSTVQVEHAADSAQSLRPFADTTRRYNFFSYYSPASLFPPTAIISLTYDNGTAFPARPAAFGPSFPNSGLSGQLWIGSGFVDDNLQDGEGEGELGCSDLPGWDDNRQTIRINIETPKGLGVKSKISAGIGVTRNQKRHDSTSDLGLKPSVPRPPISGFIDDGTDDYLEAGLSSQGKVKNDAPSKESAHADIQSLQEAAEIQDKVVLLSRGGCGFAEKVMWAQRRGARAVIVGDNMRGGPLIQMYARGDTSNITIPSVFASRTTAHILSSLMQPGNLLEDAIDKNSNSAIKAKYSDTRVQALGSRKKDKSPSKETPTNEAKPTSGKPSFSSPKSPVVSRSHEKPSWFRRLFSWGSDSRTESDVRAPQSGQLDWVMVEEWDDTKDKMIQATRDNAKHSSNDPTKEDSSIPSNDDSFQIGVQDWRDPDLMQPDVEDKEKEGNPGWETAHMAANQLSDTENDTRDRHRSSDSFISRLFADDSEVDFTDGWVDDNNWQDQESLPRPDLGDEPRDELWVTITPSSSASPFLDTLLVLVVSPLITLTVVYALLILRARIRRRRWRAPKSVVDRLPVRTYHTVSPSPTATSRFPSPTSSSPTTPLLQQSLPQDGPSRPRPRSRTSTGIPDPHEQLRPESGIPPRSRTNSRNREHEKAANSSSQWNKYMGRQVECVVCLEEYVDGVSRVMSLPCGHEFHAECITPWLTTRRRTCPICKGDVVRSLAHGTSSSLRYEPYRDDSDEEAQLTASMSGSEDPEQDVEAGILADSPPRRPHSNGLSQWFSRLFEQLTHLPPRRPLPEENRDR